MIVHNLHFPFVIEGIIIYAVGEPAGIKAVVALGDDSVLGESVVVLHVIYHLAPAVVDVQLIGSETVRVLRVDVRVEVLDGKHVVDIVPIWGDDIRENQIVLDDNGMGDLAGASVLVGDGERHVVVAPGGIRVCGREVLGVGLPVAKVP